VNKGRHEIPRGRPRKQPTQAAAATNGGDAGIGHNSNNISADDILEARREIESLERQNKSIVGKLRETRKHWAAKGLDLKIFDIVRKLASYTAPELVADFNRTVLYSQAMKLPVYSQMELFAMQEMSDDERLSDARARGMVAGRTNAPRNSPWPEETPLGREWLNAYDAGSGKAAPAAA